MGNWHEALSSSDFTEDDVTAAVVRWARKNRKNIWGNKAPDQLINDMNILNATNPGLGGNIDLILSTALRKAAEGDYQYFENVEDF